MNSPQVASSPVSPQGKSKAVGPAICLLIQGILAILTNVAATIIVVIQRPPEDSDVSIEAASTVRLFWGLWCLAGLVYQAVIVGGAVAMLRGQSRVFAKTAAIMAVIPITVVTFGFCSGVVFYLLALGGGIWGLIALGGAPKKAGGMANSPAYRNYAPAGNAAPAGNYAPKPGAPSWAGAANQGGSGSEDISTIKGVGMILGGIGCLVLAGFFSYSLYLSFTTEDSENHLRRPAKALSVTIGAVIFGFSLISTGAMALMNKK